MNGEILGVKIEVYGGVGNDLCFFFVPMNVEINTSAEINTLDLSHLKSKVKREIGTTLIIHGFQI